MFFLPFWLAFWLLLPKRNFFKNFTQTQFVVFIVKSTKIYNFFLNLGYQYGMISMKVALCSMLRRYKFTTNLKLSDLELKFELTLKVSNRHMVGMERRVW